METELKEILEKGLEPVYIHGEHVGNTWSTDLEQQLETYFKSKFKSKKIRHNEFQGLIITDFFCNGYFGSREFNLEDAIIIENTPTLITIRKENGRILQADMEDMQPKMIREYIEDWTKEKSEDEE